MDTRHQLRFEETPWHELPKLCMGLLRTEPFSFPCRGKTVGEELLEIAVPFLTDILEIWELLSSRSLDIQEYHDYVMGSPYFETTYSACRELALETVRRSPPMDTTAITKRVSLVLEVMRSLYRIRSVHRKVGPINAFSSLIFQFLAIYADMLYVRSAAAQVRGGKDERSVENMLRSTGIYFVSRRPIKLETMRELWRFIGTAKGSFGITLRGLNTATLPSAPGTQGQLSKLREYALAGMVPKRCYIHLDSPRCRLQCVLEPLADTAWLRNFAGGPRGIIALWFCPVPEGHSGFFKSEAGVRFIICGATGRLSPVHSLEAPLELLVDPERASALSELVRELACEAFTGEFRIAAPVPEERAEPVTQPEPIARAEDKERRVKAVALPRDLKGAELINLIRLMNRKFLGGMGFTGKELDERSDPRLRQTGSHATVYFAETKRVATVALHSTAIPIGTLCEILATLKIDRTRFLEALG